MVTFTPNKALGLPAVGGDTGVWGPPINNNSSAIDMSFGGVATIPISSVAGSITLLASNYLNAFLTFTGALAQNTTVTLPAVGSFYTIQNLTTNNQFTVTLATTAAGSQAIGCPFGKPTDVMTDGSNVKYRSLHQIGEYWDFAGSSVPNWVSACTVPPYLNCDGTTFSAVTYPYLNTILGGNTLPDSKGSVRAYLNQGSGRLTSSGGVDGNTNYARGGSQATALSSLYLPKLVDPTHVHSLDTGNGTGVYISNARGPGGGAALGQNNEGQGICTMTSVGTGITYGSTSQINTPTVQPTFIGGLCLIRAG